MSTYHVYNQQEWDLVASDVADGDYIHIQGAVTIPSDSPCLDICLHPGSEVSVMSSCTSLIHLQGQVLTVVWDETYSLRLMGSGHIKTVNWPDGVPAPISMQPDTTPADTGIEQVAQPDHYTWIGEAIASRGICYVEDIESWDILDAMFPDNPNLWNASKYLIRYGRKGPSNRRIVDLRKARAYIDRAIYGLERNDAKD